MSAIQESNRGTGFNFTLFNLKWIPDTHVTLICFRDYYLFGCSHEQLHYLLCNFNNFYLLVHCLHWTITHGVPNAITNQFQTADFLSLLTGLSKCKKTTATKKKQCRNAGKMTSEDLCIIANIKERLLHIATAK